jgi:hypothetical protein
MTSQTERKPGICHSCGVKVAMIPGFQNDLCGACDNLRAGIPNRVDQRMRKPARGRLK